MFCERIEGFISEAIIPEMQTPVVDVDARLNFSQITPKFLRILKQFQPFGPGNNLPIFASEQCINGGDARLVGADAEHLRHP